MFWSLVLAHLLADYPLQTDRMVMAKQRMPGLLLHIAMHLITMVILTIQVIGIVWPYLVTITLLHFIVDYFKAVFGRRRPDLVIGPYILDQIFHIAILIIVAIVMQQKTDLVVWYALSSWWAMAIGMVMASYIAHITERIAVYRDPDLLAKVRQTMWPRMMIRVLIFLFIIISPPISWIVSLALILFMIYFYRRRSYPSYWSLIDPLVAIFSAAVTLAIPLI